MGGTSCSAVQDWTQEDSRDSPSPIVGADPPTSPRYAAVDAVLFISCLMQEVLRQRSVARLCAGQVQWGAHHAVQCRTGLRRTVVTLLHPLWGLIPPPVLGTLPSTPSSSFPA